MALGKRTPAKGEIWHVNGDPVTGHEFQGPHYYLVLSEKKLVAALGTAVCVPVTSGGNQARSKAVTVWLDGDSTDTGKITGVVLCYQLRSLDLVACKGRYAATVSPWVMDEILGMVVDLIDPQ